MKIDRSVLSANNQNMGDFGDPDKLENSIKHVADVVDENDNGFNSHKTSAELDHPDKSVTEKKLADLSVSQRTIVKGSVGTSELDPNILSQPTTAFGVQAKLQQHDNQLEETTIQVANNAPYRDLAIKSANFYATSAGGFVSSRANQILDTLVADGFNYITIVPQWYMNLYTDNVIVSNDSKTQTDGDIISLIQNAHSKGLKVMLKPHVEVNDGTPRHLIAPSNITGWFNSYNDFITHMATIAQTNNVEYFVIGTELSSLSSATYKPNWQTIINNVKAIYTNKITYACIYGDNVGFWDLVDLIGINLWNGRTTKNPYTIQDIYDSFYSNTSGINDIVTLKSLSNQYGKNIIFTEIGCSNFDDSLVSPVQFTSSQAINNQVPADFTEAMFNVIAQNTDWLMGYCWWDIHLSTNDTFTFEGRPSETILKDWNTRNYSNTVPVNNLYKTHGLKIHTDETHNSTGNPHDQYVTKKGAVQTNQSTSGTNYEKIANITLTSQYSASMSMFEVSGLYSTAPFKGFLWIKALQSQAMGNAPAVTMKLFNSKGLLPSDFIAVITQNDSSKTVIEIYLKIRVTYETFFFNLIHNESIGIALYNKQALVNALPAGTQVLATYDDVVLTSTNGTNYKLAVDNTGVLSTTVLT